MIELTLIVAVALSFCCVSLLVGCVCHLFKKKSGFSAFEDSYDAESGRGGSAYPANESALSDMSSHSHITFEPLPDILAKTVGSRALRPRITSLDGEKQGSAARAVTVYLPFPRSQLLYVKEIGLGWFGQVLQGDADRIVNGVRRCKVVVKILKDDASPVEQKLFLEEVAPYKDLDHPNILRLLGQCTETLPFLAILEYPFMGDLKSYLQRHRQSAALLIENGSLFSFILDAASGLACMHQNGYIHHDFAARNCLVMSDMVLKVGDYGIADDLYREDYYDTGRDLLPVRWMSPESLTVKEGVWQLTQFTKEANIWSLGVAMWEILELSCQPYSNMRDEEVLQKVVGGEPAAKLPPLNDKLPLQERWYEIMEMCWQDIDQRPTADDMVAFIQQIMQELGKQNADFEKKWSQSSASEPKVIQIDENGPRTPSQVFESDFVPTGTENQSDSVKQKPSAGTSHVTQAIVHMTDSDVKPHGGFEDNFVKDFNENDSAVAKGGAGFEDDFVPDSKQRKLSSDTFATDMSQNDSILAGGGNNSETDESNNVDRYKNLMSPEPNIFVSDIGSGPAPMVMSTPSKGGNSVRSPTTMEQTPTYLTAQSNQETQSGSSQYLTAAESKANSQETISSQLISNKTENQNKTGDEGYKTDTNHLTENIDIITPDQSREPDGSPSVGSPARTSPEYEMAREIYMSKGTSIQNPHHSSRSLTTIPEDGIPSDSTSQSGGGPGEQQIDDSIFTPASADVESFEWDDYIGEELVGHVVRFSSDESPRPVDEKLSEWTFEQDSNSDTASQSKADDNSSMASGHSDIEVTNSRSADTRAYVASLLTNRLSALTNISSNSSHSDQSMFYSFSQNYDIDSSEYASTDPDSGSILSMPSGVDEKSLTEEPGALVAPESKRTPALDQGQDEEVVTETNQNKDSQDLANQIGSVANTAEQTNHSKPFIGDQFSANQNGPSIHNQDLTNEVTQETVAFRQPDLEESSGNVEEKV